MNYAPNTVDFAEFKKQRDAALQEANKVIAVKIALMMATLKEVSTIIELTGVKVELHTLTEALSNVRYLSGWNESN